MVNSCNEQQLQIDKQQQQVDELKKRVERLFKSYLNLIFQTYKVASVLPTNMILAC